MKPLIAFLAVAMFSSSVGEAQDYRAFHGSKSRLFEMHSYQLPDYSISSVVVENVDFDGDSIYRFAPNWHYNEAVSYCWSPFGPSMMGDSLRISSEGIHLFYNLIGEPIELRPNAAPDSAWTLYSYPNANGSIQATLVSLDNEMVLGAIEAVATITLQRLDENSDSIDSPINDFYFKIGTHSGLIEAPTLRYFPLFYGAGNMPFMINLKGIENGAGLQNLTWFEIMDFQPGDEIEVETYMSSSEGVSLRYQSERYLSRSAYPDSLVYQVEIKTWAFDGDELPPNDPLIFVDSSVVKRIILPNVSMDAPPGTPDLFSFYGPQSVVRMRTDAIGTQKIQAMEPEGGIMTEDSTFCIAWDTEGCEMGTIQTYREGLGGPYYTCNGQWNQGLRTRILKYFKKGDATWGTSYNPISTGHKEVNTDQIKIFPIPASESVKISLPANLSATALRLTDFQGRTVKEFAHQPSMELNVSHLQSGVYILQITLTTGQVVGKKIIVRD